MPLLKFNAKARSGSGNSTKTVVEAREFTIVVDEPPSLGGNDEGANPVEYVLAALAGCLNVVGHVVAKEMGFELKSLRLELEGDLDPARFLGAHTEQRAGYQAIRVSLHPETDASAAVLAEWLAAVKRRCPVSDNLANPTPVAINLGS
ncbi:MAG: OsmC family protein [Truepera sp.]|nr:OsmC family protein [Truepera sp.]